MALINCKDCGEKVSKKAKSCPKCGASTPKKTSIFTWLILLIIVYVVYVTSQNTSPKKSADGIVSSTSSKKVESAKIVKESWYTFNSKDEMTGKLSVYAHSPSSVATKRMSFPYADVKSWMGFGCDADNEWAYFGFNSAPNLTKDETKSGYSLIETKIRWNKQIEDVALTQDWGAKFIHFKDDKKAISSIAVSNSALLELQWHGEQKTYFEYSLHGSSKAIAEARAKCSAGK